MKRINLFQFFTILLLANNTMYSMQKGKEPSSLRSTSVAGGSGSSSSSSSSSSSGQQTVTQRLVSSLFNLCADQLVKNFSKEELTKLLLLNSDNKAYVELAFDIILNNTDWSLADKKYLVNQLLMKERNFSQTEKHLLRFFNVALDLVEDDMNISGVTKPIDYTNYTLLELAVHRGDVITFDFLISKGADIYQLKSSIEPDVMEACEFSYLIPLICIVLNAIVLDLPEIVERLVTQLKVDDQKKVLISLLLQGISLRNFHLTEFLQKKVSGFTFDCDLEEDVQWQSLLSQVPSCLAFNKGVNEKIKRTVIPTIIFQNVEEKKLNKPREFYQKLFDAISEFGHDDFMYFLKLTEENNFKLDLNYQDEEGNTLLHKLATNWTACRNIISIILKNDVKLNLLNRNKKTALDLLYENSEIRSHNEFKRMFRAYGAKLACQLPKEK